MLRITISRNAQAASDYFKDALSKEGGENYYLNDSIKALWKGATADFLGLNGSAVTEQNFKAIIQKVHPKTGAPLFVRKNSNARAGYDFTINAVKSLSLLHAITQDDDLLKAHQVAYTAMASAIQADAQTQANQNGRRYYETTGNLLYAAFDHFTARPYKVEKKLFQDPSLHSHLYVPAITWSPKKNRYQALEVGNIWKLAGYYESIYHSMLCKEVQKAGYAIELNRERYEIKGVDRELIDRFSGRTAEITKKGKDLGIKDPKKLSELGAKTRLSKSNSIQQDGLFDHWVSRLSKAEVEQLKSIKGRYRYNHSSLSAKEAIDQALSHHLERTSTVPSKKVIEYALKISYGSLSPSETIAELQSRSNILRMEQDTIEIITTREIALEEDEMVDLSVKGKGKFASLNPKFQPDDPILNKSQKTAIRTLLSSNDQFNILEGSAGVGKTTLLTSYKKGLEANGHKLIALAPSASASRGQLRDKGFDNADTLARFLIDEKFQEQIVNKVLLIDEAGMVSVRDMNQILNITMKKNARVTLSGDSKQFSSIARGQALKILQDRSALTTAKVNEIVRQKNNQPYLKAINHFAQGNSAEGFQALDKIGAFREIPDHEERYKELATKYISSIKAKRSALAISPTHQESDTLTKEIRKQLLVQKMIKGKENEFQTLESLHLTESQKLDLKNYEIGNTIRFTKRQSGKIMAGSHHRIVHKSKDKVQLRDLNTQQTRTLDLNQREHFQLYKSTQTALRAGDLIRLSANLQTLEKSKVNNGNTYTVKGFTKAGDLKLSNGKTLSKEAKHFKSGYVETAYSAQGKDAKDVYVAVSESSFGAMNEQAMYVSTSRGTESIQIYTPDKRALKQAALKSGTQLTAQEVRQNHENRLHRQHQLKHYQQNNQQQKDHGTIQQRKDRTATRGISR